MKTQFIDLLGKLICEKTGAAFRVSSFSEVGGGSIHYAAVIEGNNQRYFIKLNSPETLPMFIAEFNGLSSLIKNRCIRIPQPMLYGSNHEHAWLIMEYVPLTAATTQGMLSFGMQLAQLHQVKGNFFGWDNPNYIGSSEQRNQQTQSWSDFWRDQRLGFQLMLAVKNGYHGKLQNQGEQLLANMHLFFRGYAPQPSLLHGDLWNGNVGFINSIEPVIFDPAVYYGDRETDLAMTELFGGFPKEFYQAYNEYFPLNDDYTIRKPLYNLYHVLNHLNLFGGSYLNQAERMIENLLTAIR